MAKLTAIIMAAGFGSRMGNLTKNVPKTLLKIDNKFIIEYGIEFLKKCGADKIVVVGGYLFDLLERKVKQIDKDIEVVRNNDFEKENIYSVKYGLKNINSGGFILYNADHIFKIDIAEKIKNQLKDQISIFTDNDRDLTDDDMKVKVSKSGSLQDISKKLDDFELGYVGITYCPEKYLCFYKKCVEKVIAAKKDEGVSEDVLKYIALEEENEIKIGDISGSEWYEVDDFSDYKKAIRNISKNYVKYF